MVSPTSLGHFTEARRPTDVHTLSLHDALPICLERRPTVTPDERGRSPAPSLFLLDGTGALHRLGQPFRVREKAGRGDRKSTRLNSSHVKMSYAVFCLKKKSYLCAIFTP